MIDKCLVTYAYMTACAVRVQNCREVYMTLREKLLQIQEEVRAKYHQQEQQEAALSFSSSNRASQYRFANTLFF